MHDKTDLNKDKFMTRESAWSRKWEHR
jgi:hypothetical protein